MRKPSSANVHLAASLRVVSAHLHVRFASIETARETVLETALKMANGQATPDTEKLAAKLAKVTGCDLSELAVHAESWT